MSSDKISMAKRWVKWFLPFYLFTFLPFLTSCSESDDETTEEFVNWQARNDAYFEELESKYAETTGYPEGYGWKKIKCYSKDEEVTSANTDYIYAYVLEKGWGGRSPLYTDSVRVAYRGWLIPSTTYPEGYVFDQTYIGDYHLSTTSVHDAVASSFVDGFTTALMHMHEGDRWRIYIPYQLGYGASENGSIPAYSVLIFDIALIDYIADTGSFTPWSSRQQ